MATESFDLIIIGGGPGGYVSAIRASQLGLKTAVVEKNHLGGVCLNWGCIPTKALLKSAEAYHQALHLKDFGIQVKELSFDIKVMVDRSRKISETLAKGVQHLMKKNGICVVDGHGRLNTKKGDQWQVSVMPSSGTTEKILQAPRVILATGARANILKGFEPDGQVIWTAREAMKPSELPKTLVVIGSGAIGLEFASFYQMLGTQVHLVELQKQLFPVGDLEVSDLLRKSFEKRGIFVYTETMAQSWKKDSKGGSITLQTPQGSQVIQTDHILLATGIVGNVEDLGLEKTHVQIEGSHILTHGVCETHEVGIYAIGDIAAGPWLAHKASHEGIACVEHIASQGVKEHPVRLDLIPSCVYSTPQIASVGLTEAEARTKGHEVRVGKFPFSANGKALTQGDTDGFVKVIFDSKTGEILGAHLIGPEVTELISNFSLAQTLEATEEDLVNCVFPHPTLSESLHESILNGLGRGLHF
ncbi:MAG: dihydrolipoyl dehydrogenase [Holosporales bacterium]|nr:dihydrolipoyl dehydrogenase [Holosporales bacterium]